MCMLNELLKKSDVKVSEPDQIKILVLLVLLTRPFGIGIDLRAKKFWSQLGKQF